MEINEALVAVSGDQVPIGSRIWASYFWFQGTFKSLSLDGQESVSLSVIKRSGENLLAIRQQFRIW